MKFRWPKRPVSELCLAIVDCVNRTAPIVEGPTPYRMIRTTNVRGGFIDLSSVRYVDESTYQHWTRRQVPRRGDIVLTREAPLGDVGLIREDEGVFLGQRLVSYRTNPKLLNNRYLLYSLLGPHLQAQIQALGSGSTVEHMRVPDAKRLMIPTPSLEVQQRIASILGAYDDLIEVNRRRIAVLEEMARRLFEEWFVRFRFPGHEGHAMAETPDGPIPAGWRLGVLGDLIGLAYGRALKADARVPGGVPVIGSSGIVGWHNEALVKGPGIVVGRKGNVGAIVWSPCDFYPIDTVFFVETTYPLLFVLHRLRQLVFLNSDAAVPGLNRNAALSLPLVIPPMGLMAEYQAKAAPMLELAESLRQSNASLAASRDLLLPDLISGELTVATAERELEAVA